MLFCCLLCSPMSQNWPRVTQHAKVKQPIMPNDRFAYQRCQDALATMPRICNPEAMGNDLGPAAEGVAHKIRRTPAGGAGRDWNYSPFSAESEDSGRPPHCRRPLPKVFQKSSIFEPHFKHAFFHAKFTKSVEIDPKRDPL